MTSEPAGTERSVALVTGASRGIGYEFVRQHAQAGWRVIATAREHRVPRRARPTRTS